MTDVTKPADPPAAPLGAREWLAALLRWAIAELSVARPTAGAARHVVGRLLGEAELSPPEQLGVLDVVAPEVTAEAHRLSEKLNLAVASNTHKAGLINELRATNDHQKKQINELTRALAESRSSAVDRGTSLARPGDATLDAADRLANACDRVPDDMRGQLTIPLAGHLDNRLQQLAGIQNVEPAKLAGRMLADALLQGRH